MTKIYLIDGHNLIGTGLIPGINLEQEDDEARLVDWLRPRQPLLRRKLVVVFDGGIPAGTSNALSGGAVQAVFAAMRRSNADKVIKNWVRKSASPQNITVVSDDIDVRETVQRAGAKVLREREFLSLIETKAAEEAAARTSAQKEKPKLSRKEVSEYLEMFGVDPEDDQL
jgi:predicted RNA-binding protein with PIN domain